MNNKTLLILGIVFGLCFILLGIVLPKNKIEDKNVVVSVNGHPIFQSDWDLALQALAMNKYESDGTTRTYDAGRTIPSFL